MLGIFLLFQGIRTNIAKKPLGYSFVISQGGGGVLTPCPHSSGSGHDICYNYQNPINWPILCCLYIFAGCSTYGNTYEVHTNMYMLGLNLAVKTGTLQFCIDFCSSDPSCRSFEREFDTCWFSGATALTHPGSYKPWDNCNYYNRNCA